MSTKKLNQNKFQIQQNSNRYFSESFKRSKVEDLIGKRITVQQVSDLYHVSRSAVYKWLRQYGQHEPGVKIVIEMDSDALRAKVLLQKVAELERVIGQKQLEIDFLNKAFEVASEEVGYDLKKKYAPALLNYSANNPINHSTK